MSNAKKRAKHSSLSPRSILLIALAVIVLLISGTIFYKHHQKDQAIAKERAAYNQAEKDLDATAAKITAKFGQPDDSTKDKYCGYTSNPGEFEKGDLYCNIDEYLLYPVTSQDASTVLTKSIEAYFGDSSTFYTDQTIPAENIPPVHVASRHYLREGLDCEQTYIYDTKQDLENSQLLLKISNDGLLIELSCGSRPAKAAYYPIKND